MSDASTSPAPTNRKGMQTALLAVLCMPVVYFLSIGPAVWAADKGLLNGTEDFLNGFYAPLGWLYEEVPVFESFLDWYLEWFM
jgi:hypothetical protein